jgi:hypothetical protein
MRTKTAMLAKSNPANPTSETKSPVAPHAEPSRDGQVVKPEAIRRRAYEKWEAAGMPAGDGVKFWLEAERELTHASFTG